MQSTDEKTKSKKRLIKPISAVALIIIVAVFSAFVTFGSFGLPSWNEIFSACGVSKSTDSAISFSFINVGSADSCYIKCGDKNILIDGGTSLTSDRLCAYLKRNGCIHLDAIIVSHPDSDHIGGISSVIEEFGADVIYESIVREDVIPDTAEYSNYQNSIKENNIEVITPEIPSSEKIGDINLNFISPTSSYDTTNDSSLVIRLEYDEISALFTGDISKDVEESLINSNSELKSDILKISHHGSKTASTEEFLKSVLPQISVVSVGLSDNTLPDGLTMARINKYSGALYRTDRDGTIVINSDGKTLSVQTNA